MHPTFVPTTPIHQPYGLMEIPIAMTRKPRTMPNRQCHFMPSALLLVLVTTASVVRADDTEPGAKSRDEVVARQRLDLMQQRVTVAEVASREPEFPTKFEAKPIFRFSDPARGCVGAAIWKLGSKGRPKALITTELHRATFGKPCIAYEYSSLTATKFTVKSDDIQWSAPGTLYEFKPVPNGPVPEKTPLRRLIQMREITKRFASVEEVDKERSELRLLTQPVDRYVPSDAENADGAIFLFAYGTNPEVVLILESDGTKWNYAAGRMTGAQSVVLTIDEKIAWQGLPLQKGNESPYTGSLSPIDIPGVGPDGSEAKE